MSSTRSRLTPRTVHLRALGVNTFVPVNTDGSRLRAYLSEQMGNRYGWPTRLAKKSGVKRATLYKWFRDASQPDLASLADIARALNVSRAEIVAAMDGQAPVVRLDERTRELMAEELERLLAERDARLRGQTPRGGSGAAA